MPFLSNKVATSFCAGAVLAKASTTVMAQLPLKHVDYYKYHHRVVDNHRSLTSNQTRGANESTSGNMEFLKNVCEDYNAEEDNRFQRNCTGCMPSTTEDDAYISYGCRRTCDACTILATDCVTWNNFTVVHSPSGSFYSSICKTTSPIFSESEEFCVTYDTDPTDPSACEATLNGEICEICFYGFCHEDDPENQVPPVLSISCNNVKEGNVHAPCKENYEGVFAVDHAIESSFYQLAMCPEDLATNSSEDLSTNRSSSIADALSDFFDLVSNLTAEEQDELTNGMQAFGCEAHREGVIGAGDGSIHNCGPCEYNPYTSSQGYNCNQSCDECFGDHCLRATNFSWSFLPGIPPIQVSSCKRVASDDSPYYGMEYCIDLLPDWAGEEAICHASIDGLECEQCYYQNCGSKGLLPYVDCGNIVPGTFQDTCSGEAAGVFEFQTQIENLVLGGAFGSYRCPSLLDEVPPFVANHSITHIAASPWQCTLWTLDPSGGFHCFNKNHMTYTLDSSLPVRVGFLCPSPITENPTLETCTPECIIQVFDAYNKFNGACRSCTLLESGEIAYSCTDALPKMECSARDKDQNCRVWDCIEKLTTRDEEDDKNDLDQYRYKCQKTGNVGYPLSNSIPARTSISCKEPLGDDEKPNLDFCLPYCNINKVNETDRYAFLSANISDYYCDTCFVTSSGEIVYDCANVFPDMECPVKRLNDKCANPSEPRAFCGTERLDGKWLCIEPDNHSGPFDESTNMKVFYHCDSQFTFTINDDECSRDCYIMFNPEGHEELPETTDGLFCDSCTILSDGQISYDCREVLPLDHECPARDESGRCYGIDQPADGMPTAQEEVGDTIASDPAPSSASIEVKFLWRCCWFLALLVSTSLVGF